MSKIFAFCITIIIFLNNGCKLNTNSTYINDNIPAEIKSDIIKLDNKIMKAVKTNDIEKFKEVFSEELVQKVGQAKLDSIFRLTQQVLRNRDFKYKDQFYVNNTSKNVSNTIFSGLNGEYDYIIHYQALNKEMFISMLLPKDLEDEFLITLVYGLYADTWKLNIYHLGQYSISNKTAIDYLKLAQEEYNNNFLVDAANNLLLGQQCLRPADQVLQYVKEKDFNALQQHVMADINSKYTFPLTLELLKTKPQIISISPQILNEGTFPLVVYYTTINLKDTSRLRIENEEIQKSIGEVFSGIDKNKKYILYRAVNEFPDGTMKIREHYGFIQKIENE